MAVYHHGGAYADIDAEAILPLESWAKPGCEFALALENDVHFCQWAFAAIPHHGALGTVLDLLLRKILHNDYDMAYEHVVHDTTGPAIFTRGIMNYLGLADHPHYHDLELLLRNERDSLRKRGICLYSHDELEKSLRNHYSSSSGRLQSGSWTSWTQQVADVRENLTAEAAKPVDPGHREEI
jgi:mannosyltransferase OCH1-like enzyme